MGPRYTGGNFVDMVGCANTKCNTTSYTSFVETPATLAL